MLDLAARSDCALPRPPPDAEDTTPGCALQPPRTRQERKAATPPD